jgi:hypothetical protein
MGKITEYDAVTALVAANVLLADGSNGTKKITAENLAKSMAGLLPGDDFFTMLDRICPPQAHGQIFRGKNLGTSLTTAQKSEINAGTFKGLWLGDYWVINNVTWRIADFDYWYRCGDTEFTRHHVVVIPDSPLYSAKMNETNTTEGGYYGSAMRGAVVSETFTPYAEGCGLYNALTAFQSAFGDALLTHREYLDNAVTDGEESGGAWMDSIIELPSEIMIYGTHIRTMNSHIAVSSKTQLALMQASPRFINIRATYWLRDVVSATRFAYVNLSGLANYNRASDSLGVRPVGAVG